MNWNCFTYAICGTISLGIICFTAWKIVELFYNKTKESKKVCEELRKLYKEDIIKRLDELEKKS